MLEIKHCRRSLFSILKPTALIITAICLWLMPAGCSHAELWNELPPDATAFINEYYPSSELSSVTKSGATIYVRIDNGPGLTFSDEGDWISVDGYGLPLPQVMLFDQLPSRLYAYIEEIEDLNEVFRMSRDKELYTLLLLNSDITYNTETGELRGSTPATTS